MKTRQQITDFIAQCDVQEIMYMLRLGAKDIKGDECFVPQCYIGNDQAEAYDFASIQEMRETADSLNLHNDVDEIMSGAKGLWEEVKDNY